jgi:ATP-dependent DNA ligase
MPAKKKNRRPEDLTGMYRGVAAASLKLNADQAVVDGEIVALDTLGRPSFQALQHRGLHPAHRIADYAFRLLHLAREECRPSPHDG